MKCSIYTVATAIPLFLTQSWFNPIESSELLQDHDVIVEIASKFVSDYYSPGESSLEVIITEPDRRLRLAHCSRSLEAFWPYEPGSQREVSVGVRCNGNSRWKIYLSAELSQFEDVAVLSTSVRSGQTLDESMVSLRRINVLRHRYKVIQDISDYIGMKFNRSIQSGTPLFKESLDVPVTIKRGDLITIFSGKGIVEVSAEGFALSDGYVNDTIKVRNRVSKKVVQALVVDPNSVRTSR